jgi:hypothetical protein
LFLSKLAAGVGWSMHLIFHFALNGRFMFFKMPFLQFYHSAISIRMGKLSNRRGFGFPVSGTGCTGRYPVYAAVTAGYDQSGYIPFCAKRQIYVL